MKNLVQLLITPALAIGLVMAPIFKAHADEQRRPAVVVSIASIDELMGDIGYLTRAAGVPELGGFVRLMAGQFTQGLDMKRPAGSFVYVGEGKPKAVGFVPVNNLELLLGSLKDQIGEPEDAGDGVVEVGTDKPKSMFIKEQQGWAFLAPEKELLTNLPANPMTLLDGLHEKYEIAVRLNVREIPEPLRAMAVAELEKGFSQGLEARGAANEDFDPEFAKKIGENSLDSIKSLINESDKVTLGWAIDEETERTYIDFTATAIPDTELAKKMALLTASKSQFSGFAVPGAAATVNASSKTAKQDIERVTLMLKSFREQAMKKIDEDTELPTDQARATAKEIVGSFFDVATASFESGKIDFGAVLMLQPNSLNFAAGGFCADGPKVDNAFRKLADLAKDKPDFPGVNFDAEKHNSVTFHTMSVPIPDDEEDAQNIFGKELNVALGIGAQSIYIGFGNECMSLLKQVMDKSISDAEKTQSPLHVSISLKPILQFVASIDENPIVTMLTAAIGDGEVNDKISIEAKSLDHGVRYRFEIAEGVLKMFGKAAKMAQQAQAQPAAF